MGRRNALSFVCPGDSYHVVHTSVPGTDSLFPVRSRPDRLTALDSAGAGPPSSGWSDWKSATVLGTLTVLNNLDSGPGSLRGHDRHAVAECNESDTIDFPTRDSPGIRSR